MTPFQIVATRRVREALSRRCDEEIAQLLDRRVFHDEGVADAARQDQGDAAVADLLVLAHMADEAIGWDAREPERGHARWQAAILEVAAYPLRVFRRSEAELFGEVGRQNH